MSKTLCLPRNADAWSTSGITVKWVPGEQQLHISGWYDSFVIMESDTITLREFFNALAITEKDCAKAWGPKAAAGRLRDD